MEETLISLRDRIVSCKGADDSGKEEGKEEEGEEEAAAADDDSKVDAADQGGAGAFTFSVSVVCGCSMSKVDFFEENSLLPRTAEEGAVSCS